MIHSEQSNAFHLITSPSKAELLSSTNTFSSNDSTFVESINKIIHEENQEDEEEDEFEELFRQIRNSTTKSKTLPLIPTIKKYEQQNPKMGLITQIDIWSEKRLRVGDLWKSLRVYYYEKTAKTLFAQTSQVTHKNKYYSSVALLDVFSQFQSDSEHKHTFYILAKDFTILTNSYQQQKFILLYNNSFEMLSTIQSFGIHQHVMSIEGTNDYVSLIRSRSIRLFWNWMMQQLLQEESAFEVISNFRFNCSQQRLPMEVYNGQQKQPRQGKQYHLKVQGFFFKQNIQKLSTIYSKDSFGINIKTFQKTSKFQNIVAKGFLYKQISQNASQQQKSEASQFFQRSVEQQGNDEVQ